MSKRSQVTARGVAAAGLVAVLVLGLRVRAAAQERYESAEYGFAFTPPPGWACYGGDGAKDVRHQVTTYPRGTAGVPSLQVQVCEVAGSPTAQQVRDGAFAALSGREDLRARRRGQRRLLERDWPTIACELTLKDGQEVTAETCYVTAGDLVLVLTRTCATDDEQGARLLDAAMSSFALTDGAEQARLRALAARCGSLVPWAGTWQEAAGRARAERRLVAVVYEHHAGIPVPRMTASGPLSDPDLIALLQERFVVVRLEVADPAPFRDPTRFGISRHAWGSTILFVTPEGEVVREAGAGEPTVVDQIAREALATTPSATGPARARPTEPEQAAALALRRGELDEVIALLGELDTPRAHQLRAAVHRRRRQGEAALAALQAARRALGAPATEAARALALQLDADEALVRVRMGQGAEAGRLWSRVAAAPASARAAEAMYWLGALVAAGTGDLQGGGWWTRAIARGADDPWAWKAASNLLRTGAFINGSEPLAWPAEDALRDAAAARQQGRATATASGATRDALGEARRAALRYLLGSQRDGGGWPCPTEDMTLVRAGYGEAVTSICATSLLPFSNDLATRQAIERALAHVLAARERLLGGGQDMLGTYRTWARAYALRLLVRCAKTGIGEPAEVRRAIEDLVGVLVARQGSAGGWAYLAVPGDRSAEGLASSFLSAAVLLSLCEARDLGVSVPEAAITRAADFIHALRDEDGTFRYAPDISSVTRGDDHPEAAGRSPLCALAVHVARASADVDTIRRALEAFFAHRQEIADQLGKDLCHTGPSGQASYYFAFGHAYAAEAILALPPAERGPLADRLASALLAARLGDGTWLDMPGLGRPYATAMALLTLDALDRASH